MRELVLSFFGSLCPAILFNVDKKKFFWVGLSGAIGWLIFSWLTKKTGQIIMPTFAGAVAVGIYSEVIARVLKSPATIFSVSGIFPIVPGIGAYTTAEYIVQNRLTEATSKGIETIASAGSIALGIMLISTTFRVATKIREKRKTRTV